MKEIYSTEMRVEMSNKTSLVIKLQKAEQFFQVPETLLWKTSQIYNESI